MRLASALLALTLIACVPKTEELTIFHTNDLHSQLRAPKTDAFGLGGIARLSTLLTQLRGDAPSSVVLDAGDWSEGTWYYNVDTGANMLRFFGMLGYDAAVLGNHDFLSGPVRVEGTIRDAASPVPVLAANLDMASYPGAEGLGRALPKTFVKTVNGIRVGVIGLTTYEFIYESYLAPVRILNPVDVATEEAARLRPEVDVLILLSHNAFSMNEELARAVPGVDAVISGHTHRKTPKAVLVQNAGRSVPVVEAGSWGRYLGRLKLSVDRERKLVKMKEFQLHPVSPDLPEDPLVAEEVARQDRELGAREGTHVHETVVHSELELFRGDYRENPLGNLAVKAYRAETGAQLAIEEVSLAGIDVPQGPVSLMDLHDVIPHVYNHETGREWTLQVWNARGSDLSLLFHVFFSLSAQMPESSPFGWLGTDNATVVWNPLDVADGTLPVVKSISIDGRALDSGSRYSVAVTEGLLFGVRMVNETLALGIDLTQVTDTGVEAWRSVVHYARTQGKLALDALRVGGKVFTPSADLAVFPYSMNWDGKFLRITLENQGRTRSVPAKLLCQAGRGNDPVAYETPEQKWNKIGEVAVPELEPDALAAVALAWDSADFAPGRWPVRCEAIYASDPYPTNNSAVRIFYSAPRVPFPGI